MKNSKGYYSVIQYCPDRSRLESANVGVLLFCPELKYIRAKTSKGNDRIKKFFGGQNRDWSRINIIKESIEQRIQMEASNFRELADLEKFIDTRANDIQISSPRPMLVSNPEQDLRILFKQLVGGRTSRVDRDLVTSLNTILYNQIINAKLDNYIRRDVKIHVPVFNRQMRFPFSFQNSRYNLIQPMSFQQTSGSGIINAACRSAIEGRCIYKHTHPTYGNMQLIIVASFSKATDPLSDTVQHIFLENDVKYFPEPDINKLVKEIQLSGKSLS